MSAIVSRVLQREMEDLIGLLLCFCSVLYVCARVCVEVVHTHEAIREVIWSFGWVVMGF